MQEKRFKYKCISRSKIFCITKHNFNPEKIKIIIICESPPEDKRDYFYTLKNSLYITNTIEAFKKANIPVISIKDIVNKGVYLTAAVKEPRKGLTVDSYTIEKYSNELENEIKNFPNTKAILLMGDTAIKALNMISKRVYKTRAIPLGSTYKIRGRKLYFGNIRVFPSYLQTGKNFLIEKSKRRMVAEDIRNAFKLL